VSSSPFIFPTSHTLGLHQIQLFDQHPLQIPSWFRVRSLKDSRQWYMTWNSYLSLLLKNSILQSDSFTIVREFWRPTASLFSFLVSWMFHQFQRNFISNFEGGIPPINSEVWNGVSCLSVNTTSILPNRAPMNISENQISKRETEVLANICW